MIKNLIILMLLAMLFIGCSNEPKALEIGLITSNRNQKTIVWVNDEPIKVVAPNDEGVVPVVLACKKGENNFWVTTENITESSDCFTEVKILEGSWDKPNEIKTHFKWESKKAKDKSPIFKYFEKTGYSKNTLDFEDINLSDKEMNAIFQEIITRIETGLNNRNLESCGISKDRLNLIMKHVLDVADFEKQVFQSDSYEVSKSCSIKDLEFVRGKKTILAYNPSGENLFTAGPVPKGDGKMRHRFVLESLSIAKENGIWKLVD